MRSNAPACSVSAIESYCWLLCDESDESMDAGHRLEDDAVLALLLEAIDSGRGTLAPYTASTGLLAGACSRPARPCDELNPYKSRSSFLSAQNLSSDEADDEDEDETTCGTERILAADVC
mmetsp:Transcript_7625/g.22195  ORF Transcript_7625/g.22195 Transcript_7625/m.22195 type:complete len:120 (+) Transcript_7625:1379-1738(+)